MKTEQIQHHFWDYVQSEIARWNSKTAKKIYNWLNEDNLGAIVLDKNVFWVEKTCSTATLPTYVLNYIIKWGEKMGYTYLYNLKVK